MFLSVGVSDPSAVQSWEMLAERNGLAEGKVASCDLGSERLDSED